MTYQLSNQEYEGTKWKLENMRQRLAEQRATSGPNGAVDQVSLQSKIVMMQQYLREMHQYEASHGLPLTVCDDVPEARVQSATQVKSE